MDMRPVNSSNIDAIGYDADKSQLNITFKSGKTFGYTIVTLVEYKALVSSKSVGKHFILFIKPNKKAFEVLDIDEVDEVDETDEVEDLKAQVRRLKKHMSAIEDRVIESEGDKLILALARQALADVKG